jgi:hypothetical protein
MAIILEKSVFLHISKTGGSWITRALANGCLGDFQLYLKHANIEEALVHENAANKPFFAFVRNPVTWWQSRWACNYNRRFFIVSGGVRGRRSACQAVRMMVKHNAIKSREEFDNFNVWAQRVLKEPGWVTHHNQLYLGKNYDRVQYVGKYESIFKDLFRILRSIGEPFDPKLIRSTAFANQSDQSLNRLWDKRLLRKAIDNDRSFMERFGYSTDVKDYENLCL